MDRAEATGLGIAVAGHAALVVALAFGLAVTQRPQPDDAMEVSFVEEVGPVSTAPETSEAPAPALGEELAPSRKHPELPPASRRRSHLQSPSRSARQWSRRASAAAPT
jgi:hypothetical protein